MPDIPEHTQEKVHDQIAASMDILLHAKSKPSTWNSISDIEIQKIIILSNPIGLEYFQLQLRN